MQWQIKCIYFLEDKIIKHIYTYALARNLLWFPCLHSLIYITVCPSSSKASSPTQNYQWLAQTWRGNAAPQVSSYVESHHSRNQPVRAR